MRPPLRTTTFQRTSRDTERIVQLVTLLHGRLYQPKRRERRKQRAAEATSVSQRPRA
jgi:hypothetical protein